MPESRRAPHPQMATAAVPLPVFYGVQNENAAALGLGLVGAVPGTGTPVARNTPKSR